MIGRRGSYNIRNIGRRRDEGGAFSSRKTTRDHNKQRRGRERPEVVVDGKIVAVLFFGIPRYILCCCGGNEKLYLRSFVESGLFVIIRFLISEFIPGNVCTIRARIANDALSCAGYLKIHCFSRSVQKIVYVLLYVIILQYYTN